MTIRVTAVLYKGSNYLCVSNLPHVGSAPAQNNGCVIIGVKRVTSVNYPVVF